MWEDIHLNQVCQDKERRHIVSSLQQLYYEALPQLFVINMFIYNRHKIQRGESYVWVAWRPDSRDIPWRNLPSRKHNDFHENPENMTERDVLCPDGRGQTPGQKSSHENASSSSLTTTRSNIFKVVMTNVNSPSHLYSTVERSTIRSHIQLFHSQV